jgi:Domain of unknown function (DUF4326)
MTTRVVNLRDGVPYDVYIGRVGQGQIDGYFGNPFSKASRHANVVRFKDYFYERIERDPEYKARVLALKGKTLGCFCKPLQCHGDIIAAWVNSQP